MGDRGRHGEIPSQPRQGQRDDAGARSKVRHHREVVQPPFAANNRSRTAELTTQGQPQLQIQPVEGARGPWGRPRAPRGLCLRRRENGFGFTLRHFIVYPPESYSILQSERRLWGGILAPGSGLRSIDEPMDTIFVKNVKENSPAHAAGLATGDRIISVNGETIGGKSYAEVVQLIQQSTKFLHLLVVPKEDDILQLYFADTAHNPETNQRPIAPSSMRSPEAMLRSSAQPTRRIPQQQQQQQHLSHLPKPRPYRASVGDSVSASPRCVPGSGPSSIPEGVVFQQGQAHSWHLVARAHPAVARRSSDTNLRIREVDAYCDPYQVEDTDEHRRRASGGSGWSSTESAGNSLRASLPGGGAFSPQQRPHAAHSPPSFCSGGSSADGSSEGTLAHDSNGSLHSLPASYGSPFCSLDPRRRDSTASLPPPTMRCDGFRDPGPPPASSPSGGSGACYPEDDDDSAVTDSVMRRIRKSFEQKEEFLRRPTQPIWLPQTTAPIPREFYAHPQKFQRPPWPPSQQNGGDLGDSPGSPSKPTSPSVIPRKGGTAGIEGQDCVQVQQQLASGGSARQRHSGKAFVTTLSRITENLPSAGALGSATPPQSPPPSLQLVSRRARQFESGEVAEEGEAIVDKTNFYRSELSRLSSKKSVPNVAVRKREFECRGGKESRSFDSPGSRHLNNSGSASASGGSGGGGVTARGSPSCPPSPAPRTPSPKPSPLPAAFIGNRLTPVGGGWLHCEPPGFFFEQHSPTPEEEPPAAHSPSDPRRRSRSNSADDSWAVGATTAWVQKHHSLSPVVQHLEQPVPVNQQPTAPHHQQQQIQPPEVWRSSTHRGEAGDGGVPPPPDSSPTAGRRLVRQHSYLAAVKKPIHAGDFAMQEDLDDSDDEWLVVSRSRSSAGEATEAKRRPQALRPTHLDIPHPIRPASIQQLPPSPDEEAGGGGDSSTTAGTPTSFPSATAAPASTPTEEGAVHFPPGEGVHFLAATTPEADLDATSGTRQQFANRPSPTLQTAPTRSSPVVVRRQKTASQIEDEAERAVRRVSYLKATWGDRMHVDSDLDLSDGEQASGLLRPHDLEHSSRSSCAADVALVPGISQSGGGGSTAAARQPHGILRLRSLFTDRQHHHQDTGASITAIPSLHSGSNKENHHVVKEGWLQCKFTVVEGKRSTDRSWKQVRAILRGSFLHLMKDRKETTTVQQQTPGMMLGQSSSSTTGSVATLTSASTTTGTITSSSSSSSEEVVDVRNGVVDVAGDYTKRKHVFRLSAGPGGPGTHSSELLLQAEDSMDMLQWIRALQESGCRPEGSPQLGPSEKESSADATPNGSSAAPGSLNSSGQGLNSAQPVGSNLACSSSSTAASAALYTNRLSPLPAHKGIRKLTSFRNRSPTGQSPVNKTRKSSQGDQLPSPKSKTWKGRVAKQFRRIQQGGGASSPSSPTTPRPEGVTIGIPLEDCPQSTFCEYVPLLVELCTSIVEARGLDIIGIYRVPGNTAAVASLTEGVNRGFDCINMQDARWNDVNVISSLLKLFFRKLPDSLLTSELYPLFIESDKIEGPERRIATIRKLVHELPDHHFETLKYLLFHLKKVVSHCHVNKMEARNLAIVFGPTLVRTANDNMVTMVTDMSHQCRIVETLISHVDWFFSDEDIDDLSTIPFDICAEVGESSDASGANQNLLLNNIQKVEGMKADSPSKEISAKDIVSSIISAANRKMQKAKGGRKAGGSGGGLEVGGHEVFGECVSDHRDGEKQGCDKHRSKEEGGHQARHQGESREGAEGSSSGCHGISTSEDQHPQRVSVASSILGSVIFSGNIVKSIHEADVGNHNEGILHQDEDTSPVSIEEEQSPPAQLDQGSHFSPGHVVDMGGTIRTYTGLSATTQERIRRFELETRAMLQRDLVAKQRSSEAEQLAVLAGSDQGSDISTQNKETLHSTTVFIKPMAQASDESSPEVSRSSLSAIHGSSSRLRLHSHPAHQQRNSSPSSRHSGLCTPPLHDPSISASIGKRLPLGDTGNTLHPLREKGNVPEESVKHEGIRRGSSVENLAQLPGIQVQCELPSEHPGFDIHKSAPNSTLKRLKTEREQPPISSEVGPVRLPPTPTAVRRGSLDSLQEAYNQEGRDRPQSDVSDDGNCLIHWTQKILAINRKCFRQAQGHGFWCFLSHLHPQANFPLSHVGGSDLLASLTSTFDKKLRSLLGPGTSHSSHGEHYSAQGSPRESRSEETKEVTSDLSRSAPGSSFEDSSNKLPERLGTTVQQEPEKSSVRKEKETTGEVLDGKAARVGSGDNRKSVGSFSSSEVSDSKPRRSDSLSKTEKTEANTKTKDGERQWRRKEAGVKRGGDDEAKLKRKNGMPDRSIKRRHTVGGTKDFDKLEWAVSGGRDSDRANSTAVPDEKERGVVDSDGEVGLKAWLARERLRTSSPDLGCRRVHGGGLVVEINVLLPGAVVGRCGVVRGDSGPGGGVSTRPHGIPNTRVHEQPLESHV
ncbi:rho GTPase-activating protein 21 [Hetaerina americana]|uniref:rho GTPase-activating protein 21 n=1 Tax=Hetaerina americana TaxID=62018 RepID=UPI003A7F1EC3